ncbi:MFS transporter [Mesorhizobium sp. M7A.F.Ca.US.001.04.1.1]|uniref:MFS transporter n=1 Tax=unclassified Mesorhizobium TaxID=325217 RepID=UPI000FCB264C|nr:MULTISPECIES: MFS transporter [unclassified Mesorhizobium]RUY27347.1 MFS transporter [Mesorhizobium sp. M7A.F.Ca.US.001.04.2.1]RUY39393.1 MFS transporter [Mesorhizobium sp. M7A.F.Ca.US.001.04.1.1]
MAQVHSTRPQTTFGAAFWVLAAISICHLLNDMMQSLLPAMYPMLKSGLGLNFSQLGLLTLTYQLTASLLQPIVGVYIDRKPNPLALTLAMTLSIIGLVLIARAPGYPTLLIGAAVLGAGSSIFHPESSRLARLASGGAHGFAQSLFQVGGNVGASLGPIFVALFLLPRGQSALAWFALAGFVGMAIVMTLSHWYIRNAGAFQSVASGIRSSDLGRREVATALSILVCLLVSKGFYIATFTSYYVFYLVEKFQVSGAEAQIHLFLFLAAVAAGTMIGGPLGDRIGRKPIIWGSIVGVLPFALVLPYVGLAATVTLAVVIGLVLASSFSAIVVYAQELLPGRVGMVSGFVFGLAFGIGGVGAVVIGMLADATSISFVYKICALLPAIGFLAIRLPNIR